MCKIDIYVFLCAAFSVRSVRLNKKKREKREPFDMYSAMNNPEGEILRVKSSDPPNGDDLALFLSFLKIAQDGDKDYIKGGVTEYKAFDGICERTTTTVKVEKYSFESWLGLSHGTGPRRAAEESLIRMAGTQIIIYNKNWEIKRTFNLLLNISTESGFYRVNFDNVLLDMCAGDGRLVRWLAIHRLKGQLQKLMATWLDCQRKPSIDIGSELLIKAFYAYKPPQFEVKRQNYIKYDRRGNVDEEATLSAMGREYAEEVQRYAIEMKAYERQCREYRRQIRSALDTLKQERFITSWYEHTTPKAGRLDVYYRYNITKGDSGMVELPTAKAKTKAETTAATSTTAAAPLVTEPVAVEPTEPYDDGIPF